jgi:hypothetical protein
MNSAFSCAAVATGDSMKVATSVAVVWLACGSGAASAINKCIDADGGITYTDAACVGATTVHKIEPPPQPDAAAQADARARGERAVDDARALDARIDAAAAERRRRDEANELPREAQDSGAREVIVYPAPIIRPRPQPAVRPVVPPKPVAAERPATMGNLRFSREP